MLTSGCTIFAAIAEGTPAPIVARALSSSSVLGKYAGYWRAIQTLYNLRQEM